MRRANPGDEIRYGGVVVGKGFAAGSESGIVALTSADGEGVITALSRV